MQNIRDETAQVRMITLEIWIEGTHTLIIFDNQPLNDNKWHICVAARYNTPTNTHALTVFFVDGAIAVTNASLNFS